MSKKDEPLFTPFTILIDQQEGLPYSFAGLRSFAKQGRRPLVVPSRITHLKTADYTIEGLESIVCVERKGGQVNGAADLFATIGQGRDRFERELERMSKFRVAHVVVEASWDSILFTPPEHSRLDPQNIWHTVNAWEQRFPRVHWHFFSNRRLAEIKTFRILQRAYRDVQAIGAAEESGDGDNPATPGATVFSGSLELLRLHARMQAEPRASDRRAIMQQVVDLGVELARGVVKGAEVPLANLEDVPV